MLTPDGQAAVLCRASHQTVAMLLPLAGCPPPSLCLQERPQCRSTELPGSDAPMANATPCAQQELRGEGGLSEPTYIVSSP